MLETNDHCGGGRFLFPEALWRTQKRWAVLALGVAVFVLGGLALEARTWNIEDGSKSIEGEFSSHDAEAGNHPEFDRNVATVYSQTLSKGGSSGGHYSGNAETHMNVGEGMSRAMAELFQG